MLWAITSYFNPASYQTKKRNYDLFRKYLGVPLLAVELANDTHFELNPGDADCLVQIQDGHVLWQKERLLNIGLSHLPAECTAVAWIDADVIFENPEWSKQTLQALEHHHFVQPFDELLALEQHQTLAERSRLPAQRRSFAAAYSDGTLPPDYLSSAGTSKKFGLAPGHAWAARRSLLEQSGFYDAMILGGGDRAMINAMFGEAESYIRRSFLTSAHAKHYRNWATRLFQITKANIGFVPGRLTHLWHGDMENRNYLGRHAILADNEFDPEQDIERGPQQVWRWSTGSKPRLRQAVADYFRDRKEDG